MQVSPSWMMPRNVATWYIVQNNRNHASKSVLDPATKCIYLVYCKKQQKPCRYIRLGCCHEM